MPRHAVPRPYRAAAAAVLLCAVPCRVRARAGAHANAAPSHAEPVPCLAMPCHAHSFPCRARAVRVRLRAGLTGVSQTARLPRIAPLTLQSLCIAHTAPQRLSEGDLLLRLAAPWRRAEPSVTVCPSTFQPVSLSAIASPDQPSKPKRSTSRPGGPWGIPCHHWTPSSRHRPQCSLLCNPQPLSTVSIPSAAIAVAHNVAMSTCSRRPTAPCTRC